MDIEPRYAETQVLGSIMIDPEFAGVAIDNLTDDCFTDDKRKKVFSAMRKIEGDINVVSVAEVLRGANSLDSVGGYEYLANICQEVATTITSNTYLDIVIKNRIARNGYNAVLEAQRAFKERDIKKAEKLLGEIDFGADEGKDKTIQEINLEFQEFLKSKEDSHIDTGYTDLDSELGGLHGGDLVIVAARPAMGKSAFAVNVMENAVIDDEVPTLLFSFEMSTSQIFARMVSIYSKVNMENILKKKLTLGESGTVRRAANELSGEKFFIYDRADLATVNGVAKVAREEQKKNGIKLIIIDYLQLMSVPGMNGDNRNGEVSKITRGLKLLAKELDVPIVLLSQLSRASEKRTTKMPMLSDLRDSGAIEQDADIVMFLHRPGYYGDTENDGVCQVNIAKHRQGPTGTVELAWVDRYTAFGNLERSGWMDNG